MRRSLVVLLVVALAASGAAVLTRTTAPGPVARVAVPDAPVHAEGARTAFQLLAASEPESESELPPPHIEPAEPPPDDVALLNEAITAGDLDVVMAMIATGFPVNTDDGREPLAVARDRAIYGDVVAAQILALLQQHGATARPDPPEPQERAAVEDDVLVRDPYLKRPARMLRF